MADASTRIALPLCPSARPGMEGSVVLGVVVEGRGRPLIGYLAAPIPVTEDVLALAGAVEPTEIFRFGAACAGHGCRHFDGADCRLAARVVKHLGPAVVGLPPCPIRARCQWWQQEGKEACLRCPQIIAQPNDPSDLLRMVAEPSISA